MKFADESSKQYASRTLLAKKYLLGYLKKYILADNWHLRKKICEDARHWGKIIFEEDFKKLPAFVLDLEKLSFNGAKGQDDGNNLMDIYQAMYSLFELFEVLKRCCYQKIRFPDAPLPDDCIRDNSTLVIRYLKLPLKHHAMGIPLEMITDFENKVLKLPEKK